MSLPIATALEANVESRIEAFESAWQHNNSVNLEDFLPQSEDPSFLSILCELVRIDMEFRWTHESPRTLDSYLQQFPWLQNDAEALRQVAFEEYRQRLQKGEEVAPCEYQDRYDVDISHWPAPPARAEQRIDNPKTCALPNRELEEAILARPEFHVAGAASERTSFPEKGETFAGFRIVDELGRGAFGRVFLAEQLDLAQRRVALKVSHELNGESQKLAQLQHTNIMPIFSAHKVGSLQVVCMPYYGATTLAQIIEGLRAGSGRLPKSGRIFLSTLFSRSDSRRSSHGSNGIDGGSTIHGAAASTLHDAPAPAPQPIVGKSVEELEELARMTHVDAALWIIARVADGLDHAHSRNILHRDLKPANILLTDEGQPMLLDFNLATSYSVESLNRYKNGGTLPYMSPEQLAAIVGGPHQADSRSDLYALGVILYELLTGRHPFRLPKGKVMKIASAMVQDRLSAKIHVRKYNPQVTPAVQAIVRKLLAPNPIDRYQSALELQEDLDRQLENLPLKFAREASMRERIEKFRRRHPRVWTAALVTLAAGLLVILPVSLQTAKRFEEAERLNQTQTAEAVLQLRDTQKIAVAAQLDLYARSESATTRQRGMGRVETIVSRYHIDNAGKWINAPAVARLSTNEREELLACLGQTMWAMSTACRQQATDLSEPQFHAKANYWHALAKQCFEGSGKVPQAFRASGNGSVREALADLSKLDDADLYSQASDAVNVGSYREGLRLLKELTGRDPTHFVAWFMRGLCSEGLGYDNAAAEAWTVCIALQPEFAKAYFNRGVIRSRQKDYEAAHADFGRALTRDTSYTAALVNKGLMSWMLKKYERAEEELTQALSHEDPPSRVYFLRAKARRELKKFDLANADEAKGMSIEPTDDVGWTTRGFTRMEKEPKAALSDFNRALEINPRNRDALNNRVHVIYTHLKQYDAALPEIDRMLQYYPDHLGAHASRGVICARLGKIKDAKGEADYCLAMDQSAFNLYQIGSLYALLSKHDPAAKAESLRLLKESLASGLADKKLFATDHDLDPIRDDPEFTKLAQYASAISSSK